MSAGRATTPTFLRIPAHAFLNKSKNMDQHQMITTQDMLDFQDTFFETKCCHREWHEPAPGPRRAWAVGLGTGPWIQDAGRMILDAGSKLLDP